MPEDLFEPIKEILEPNNTEETPKVKMKPKRDIFRFAGEKPSAINLDHVTQIILEEKKITFQFYSTAMFVEFESEEAAKNAFEQILSVWSADVLE